MRQKPVGTSAHFLEKARNSAEPEFDILGLRPSDLPEEDLKKAGVILGQLLIGRAAEIAFEDIYRQEIGSDVEFKLVDLREARTDTDYRVLNGRDRPIYRVNIKFFEIDIPTWHRDGRPRTGRLLPTGHI